MQIEREEIRAFLVFLFSLFFAEINLCLDHILKNDPFDAQLYLQMGSLVCTQVLAWLTVSPAEWRVRKWKGKIQSQCPYIDEDENCNAQKPDNPNADVKDNN